jgi:transposase
VTRRSLARRAIVGVDTHKDVHVAVALDQDGRVMADRLAPSTQRGCSDLHRWAAQLAPAVEFAIEGTGRMERAYHAI